MRYIGVTTYAYEGHEHIAQNESNIFYRGGR
ncbi:hypothetical protein PMI06_008496 [Burkholderia sp. BT03]|nr:hypothetical protein PMI06_008496 [Burkholderia sp. BT03]SKC48398.1 hypothetical protein SAMN06266956_0218 [Paraburkholderia hospita]